MAVKKHRTRRGGRGRKRRRASARRTRLKFVHLGLNNVHILQWNCGSIKQRRPVLDRLVYSADVVALQVTRLSDGGVVRIAGIHSFYSRRHLGQTILVRDSIVAQEVDMLCWNCDKLQRQAVRVQTVSHSFVLVNVYACDMKVDAQRWQCFNEILSQEGHVIFCGDFNAKGKSWGNSSLFSFWNCIGQNFAMNEMKITIANVIRNFKLTSDPSKPARRFQGPTQKTESGAFLFAVPREKL